jgi:hypothetical protein
MVHGVSTIMSLSSVATSAIIVPHQAEVYIVHTPAGAESALLTGPHPHQAGCMVGTLASAAGPCVRGGQETERRGSAREDMALMCGSVTSAATLLGACPLGANVLSLAVSANLLIYTSSLLSTEMEYRGQLPGMRSDGRPDGAALLGSPGAL